MVYAARIVLFVFTGCWLCSILSLVVIPGNNRVFGAELHDELRREAAPKWKGLLECFRSYYGTCVYEVKEVWQSGARSKRTTTKGIMRSRPGCRLYPSFVREETGRATKRVAGYNPQYAFVIRSMPAREDWVLETVTLARKGSAYSESCQAVDSQFEPLFHYALGLGPKVQLADLVTHRRFEIVGSRRLRIGDRDLLEVSFKMAGQDPHSVHEELDMVNTGTILLDREASWMVKQGRVILRNLAGYCRREWKNEWKEADGKILPTRITVREDWALRDAQRLKINRTFRFDFRENSWPEPEDFRLTAFGLPEPPGVDWTPPTPWYVYAGAAGIILFALCFAFGVWKQRLKARGA